MLTTYIKAQAKYNIEHNETTIIDEDDWDAIDTEFKIICAETGRDREGCFDPEVEMYEYVTEILKTDDWRVE